MIEFNGYISGNTEKYFWKRTNLFTQNFWICMLVLWIPLIMLLAKRIESTFLAVFYLSLILLMPLLARLPKSKSYKQKMTPNRIIIFDGFITSIYQASTETRTFDNVKVIKDFGEFYVFVFPFGKVSMNFICQKVLNDAK